MLNNLFVRIRQILDSPVFFRVVLVLFILQVLWLVFSAVYPMAFDEAYHFTYIQLYSSQWLPFINQHPEGFDHLGVVTRDTSYMYHYLMSFPYRAVGIFTQNELLQIIVLRIINLSFFVAALVLIKKVLTRAGVSKALANVSVLLFTFIPIVPLLAAHINYDNLLILLIAWIFLITADIISSLSSRAVPTRDILLLIAVVAFTSVVKIASLPILLAIAVFVVLYAWRVFRGDIRQKLLWETRKDWRKTNVATKAVLIVAILIGGALSIERYGGNLVLYQTPLPDCTQVLTEQQCMEFGPWERTRQYKQLTSPDFEADITWHIEKWFEGMWYRTFFMINGDVEVDRYQNFAPLPLPALTATTVFIIGLLSAIWWRREIFATKPFVVMLGLTVAFYVFTLWLRNYIGYVDTGRAAALNGRYLLMVATPLMAIAGLALGRLLRYRDKLKILLAVAAILLFLNGGGVTSFIVRSSSTWYWPHFVVVQINRDAQETLRPAIYGSETEHFDFIDP